MVKILGADCRNVYIKIEVASHGFRDFGISVITDIGDTNIDSISHDD
jgi:hypothetical protein